MGGFSFGMLIGSFVNSTVQLTDLSKHLVKKNNCSFGFFYDSILIVLYQFEKKTPLINFLESASSFLLLALRISYQSYFILCV